MKNIQYQQLTGYKHLLSHRELELLVFKWELLRRNKKYQKFYKTYIPIFSSPDYTGTPYLHKLLDKVKNDFGIAYPLSPDRKVTVTFFKKDAVRRNILFDFFGRPIALVTKLNKDGYPKKSRILSTKELAKLDSIELKINLSYSQNTILNEIGKIIDAWKSLKKRCAGKIRIGFRARDFEWYLKIWDYKNIHPQATFREIARKVYRLNRNTDELTLRVYADRVSKAYKTCCKLIDGEYRKVIL